MECSKCSKNINNKGALIRHENACNGITPYFLQSLYNNGMSFDEIIQKYGVNSRGKIKRISRKEALEKLHNSKRGSILSIDQKNKISAKLKYAHKEGRHPGWKHINCDPNRRSYPERFFLKVLKNEGILKKYKVLEQLQVDKYFLDFAIIDIKLDLEIDGNQHYISEDAINHDILRNNYLIDNGWKVYRINWKDFYSNTKKAISELINYIDNIHNETSKFYKLNEVVELNKTQLCEKIKYEKSLLKNKLISEKIQLILTSNIDFQKIGWIKEVSIILNISPQKVTNWMKRYMIEFYNNNCYKRKAPVSPQSSKLLKA